jgi:signal transduction histidine kinase/ActR/RegA family two-component response regulator
MRQFNLLRSFWIVPGLALLAMVLVGFVWIHQSSKDYLTTFADNLRQEARALGQPLQGQLQSGQIGLDDKNGQLKRFLTSIVGDSSLKYDLYDPKGTYLLTLPLDRPRPLEILPANVLFSWLQQGNNLFEIPGLTAEQPNLAVLWTPKDQSFILVASRPVREADQGLSEQRWRVLTLILCLIALIMVISVWSYSFISRLEEQLAKSKPVQASISDVADIQKRTQFLAMMSHELRTPLTSVVGFARLLSKQTISPEANQYLRLIDESSVQLMKIIDDILDFSKLESGQVQRTDSLVVVEPFFQSLKDIAGLFIGAKPVAMRLSLAQSLPASIYVDGSKLRQILQIFLTNAAKFTAQGEISLNASYSEPNLIISIKDSGTGIPESKLKSLFDPFQQADHDQAMRDRGSGLGLAIAKRLADLLGGTISISSRYGSGTTIELTLPVILPKAETAEQLDQTQNRAQPQRQLRILIADDSSSSRLLLQIILSNRGHQVESVDNGEEALLKIQNAAFDLVILDMQMPRMDGLECARAIRALPVHQQPSQLVALTAQTFDEDKQAAQKAGFDRFISKPYSEEQIDALLCSNPGA